MTPRNAAISHVRDQVDQALQAFLHRQREVLLGAGADLKPGFDAMAALLATGKRLRPAFCYWGWRGAGGEDCAEIFSAAAALELLHAGALVHDDLMDASDTRRGQPSLHRQFEASHAAAGWRGSPQAFGMGAAVLLGDLLMCWTDELFHRSGLPADALLRARPVLDLMRTEVFAGQYLDLFGQAGGDGTVESALRVVEYKTAKYTIERPLHLGAALAGAPVPGWLLDGSGADRAGMYPPEGYAAEPGSGPPVGSDEARSHPPVGSAEAGPHPPVGSAEVGSTQAGSGEAGSGPPVAAAYAAYGLPLGVAFQLRDDILGVFGDPEQTGKPAGDDLREGKRTVLLAITRARATASQAAVIARHLGNPLLDDAGTAEVREVITKSGALAECERMIDRHVAKAHAALAAAPIPREVKNALAELAVAATARHD
jgi:geranylgeranyl pyrophosphate synthase